MPCNSDYLAPTHRERQLRDTAILLRYVLQKLRIAAPERVNQAAEDLYCSIDLVPDLCSVLSSLDVEERDKIVYNARDPLARRLADWWEKHLEADRARQEKDEEQKRQEKIKQEALDKLTCEELKALGLHT